MKNDSTGANGKDGFVHSGSSPTLLNTPTNENGKVGLVNSGSSPTADEILNIALQYAKRGWPILPLHTPDSNGRCSCHKPDCENVGKHPRTRHGLKDATTDEGRIYSWWKIMFRSSNIGIATGIDSGFVVLDVDPLHDGDTSLAYLEDEYGKLPETLQTITGSGGTHYFFSVPKDGLRGSVSKISQGLDIRGDGNYIVAPPSLHASEQRYTWKNKLEIAPMPEWLLELARTQQRSLSVAAGECIPEGKRNNTLASLAGSMRQKGFDEPAIAAALLETNKSRCEPPLEVDEVRAIASSIGRYEPGQLDVGQEVIPVTGKKPRKPKQVSPSKVPFESASDLLSRKFAEPKWAVPDLLSEGATVFAGPPKVGKSFLALGLAIAISSGGRALGSIQVEEGDVLYLALEDGPKRMQRRLKAMLDGSETPERLTFCYAIDHIDEGGLEAIEEWLKHHKEARLVVVDTLKRIRPIERRTRKIYDNDYDAVSSLNDLGQEHGVSIALIHHTTKQISEADWFDDISGSFGLSAAVDSAMLLRRPRGEQKGSLYVAGRDIEDKKLEVQFDSTINGWKLCGNAMSNRAEKLLRWLREAGESGLSRSEMNLKNGGRNDGIAEALTELKGRGLADFKPITTKGKAQERWYAASYLVTHYSDDNDDIDDVSLETSNSLLSSKSSTSSIAA